ncbi:hypothetical protein ZWY2020_013638 [Hordeum vulgare]|nr:hypothetical protein ZWY2020_013638 [Hordeum vulgare]
MDGGAGRSALTRLSSGQPPRNLPPAFGRKGRKKRRESKPWNMHDEHLVERQAGPPPYQLHWCVHANSDRLNFADISRSASSRLANHKLQIASMGECAEEAQKISTSLLSSPTVEQIESFNQSYFKYGMELGCPTFVPVNDSEMGFEMMLKIAHARGVCKQQDIISTMRNEREQAVQSMDAYIRVLTSIPGIDDHDANMVKTRKKMANIRVREAVQKAKETEHSRSPNITEDTPQAKPMLATMSHEIGSPLSEVLRIAELLATTKLGQEQHQLLELILSSENDVLQSIDGILGLSKVESGVMKLQSAIFRPREVVEHVLQTASSFMKKELILEGCVGDDVPSEVIGDARKIQEILTNLISDAPHNGQNSLRTSSEYYIGRLLKYQLLEKGKDGPGLKHG